MLVQLTSPKKRTQLKRQAVWLESGTVGYNVLEGIVAVTLGSLASSVALVSFGIDSAVEVMASLVLLWRLTRQEKDAAHAAQLERRAVLLVGISFLVLAIYIAWHSIESLLGGVEASPSWGGIGLAIASLIVMPWLASQKKKVAKQLNSRALSSEANQTSLCAYLSAVLLGGLLLNALFQWWWADPLVSLVIVGMMVKEGWENIEVWRGRKEGGCCASC